MRAYLAIVVFVWTDEERHTHTHTHTHTHSHTFAHGLAERDTHAHIHTVGTRLKLLVALLETHVLGLGHDPLLALTLLVELKLQCLFLGLDVSCAFL